MKYFNTGKLISLFLTGSIVLSTFGGYKVQAQERSPFMTTADSQIDKNSISKNIPNLRYVVNSTTYGDIYKDVKKIKELIQNNNISNLFLDVENFFNREISDKEDKFETLVYLLEDNGIEFSILAKEATLLEYKSLFSGYRQIPITSGDIDKSKYDLIYLEGQSRLYGNIKELNLDNINTDSFLDDEVYVVEEGDTLKDIAEDNGMEYLDLMRYNGFRNIIVSPKTRVLIPNQAEDSPLRDYELIKREEIENDHLSEYETIGEDYARGIDVSFYQGDIDWTVASDKIDFAILRVADAINKDSQGNIEVDTKFKQNIKACNELGIPVGIYIYTRARNEEEIKQEIDFVLNNLVDENGEPYIVSLPIYRDLEGEYASELETEEGRERQVNLTLQFCEEIERHGYSAGVYLHKKYMSKIPEILEKYHVWGNGGWLYHVDQSIENLKCAYNSDEEAYELHEGETMFQPTSYGNANEIGINQGSYVDLDYADADFIREMVKKSSRRNRR